MKIKAKKSLGQNFLIDKNILKKISDLILINKNSNIVEIGPGTGALTEFLIRKETKNITIIEKDLNLAKNLKKKFNEKVKVINEDILKFNDSKIFNAQTVVCGNLPYNISSQILVNFILNPYQFKFEKLIFMFQKEMADRILAKVNSKNYGRLSILSNWKFNIKKIIDISPNSFYPKPKVDSSLLVFKKKKEYQKFKNPKNLEFITRVFFNQRRKKIKKPLNVIFNRNLNCLIELNLDLDLRPQNIELKTYFDLVTIYENLVN